MSLSFATSAADRTLIEQIVDRALGLIAQGEHLTDRDRKQRRVNLIMDLSACHASGNPLRLADLATADDFNLFHDVAGIARHIDRDSGELTDFFSPRFSDNTPRTIAA